MLSRYNYDHQIAYRHRLVPVLDQAIFPSPVDELLGPLTSEYGHHLLLVKHHFAAGEATPLELVRKQIYNRLFQAQLALTRITILDSLREVTNVEIYVD